MFSSRARTLWREAKWHRALYFVHVSGRVSESKILHALWSVQFACAGSCSNNSVLLVAPFVNCPDDSTLTLRLVIIILAFILIVLLLSLFEFEESSRFIPHILILESIRAFYRGATTCPSISSMLVLIVYLLQTELNVLSLVWSKYMCLVYLHFRISNPRSDGGTINMPSTQRSPCLKHNPYG